MRNRVNFLYSQSLTEVSPSNIEASSLVHMTYAFHNRMTFSLLVIPLTYLFMSVFMCTLLVQDPCSPIQLARLSI